MFDWNIYTDKELMKLKQDAVEMQDSKWLKAITAEITRRNRDE